MAWWWAVLVMAAAVPADWRHIEAGHVIPDEGYCDQPYVVVTETGDWVCTMTTGPGHEGNAQQHVVSTISRDKGRTWSPLTDIEPHGPPEASWVMPLQVPGGRIYVFYVYNAGNMREVIASTDYARRRVDTLGHYVFKYSDDGGQSWSAERYRVPIRTFDIDRENPYGGEVQFFWGVGKPVLVDGTAYIGLAKVGSFGDTFIERSEGFFLRSTNIATEPDPAKIEWETLPEGTVGLRAPEGPIAEEHNLVALEDGSLYCTYRTIDGHPCHAYSRDSGATWTGPAYMTYEPGGRQVKHPRAANFVRKFSNGKYLYWFHNHGGQSYEGRNPAWLSAGIERDGHLYWSQPEIVLYADDPKLRMSYPDFIEDAGEIYITETQKSVARVHPIPREFLDMLWSQQERAEIARTGLALEWTQGDGDAAMPPLPRLAQGTGFALDLTVAVPDDGADGTLLDTRTADGQGLALTLDGGTLALRSGTGDGEHVWESDPGLFTPGRHHVSVIVEGGPRLVLVVVDGQLCDGGAVRSQGWYRLPEGLDDFNGAAAAAIGPRVERLGVYERAIRVTEAVGNWRALAHD